MFCVIYRSSKRDQTYLYVEKKDDFSRIQLFFLLKTIFRGCLTR
ncbi:hypothetical protein LTSEMIS_1898 [Salmonella enterica subsp. enterica serovar Mississippi str. A4-633]|nr:hypothetical protein LTSEMIS_1898 [Salmonella enterica subsp. enterica serovar Mississippi str. A4-633]